MRFTPAGGATFTGSLVVTYTFCRSGSVPTGQVEVTMTRTAPGRYTGTVRFYRVSDCTWIGDAQGATWEYDPYKDTLLACSYSPRADLPGGGCEVATRVARPS